jgi:hypothetical protein
MGFAVGSDQKGAVVVEAGNRMVRLERRGMRRCGSGCSTLVTVAIVSCVCLQSTESRGLLVDAFSTVYTWFTLNSLN